MPTPWNTNRYRERVVEPVVNRRDLAGQLFRVEASDGSEVAWYGDYLTSAHSFSPQGEGTWDYVNPGPPYLSGWNFKSIKGNIPLLEVKDSGKYRFHNDYQPASWDWEWRGGFYDPVWYPVWDYLADVEYSPSALNNNPALVPDLSAIGAGAYAKLRPRVEQANLAVSIAEARDLPRMLKSTAKTFHNSWKTLGGDLSKNPMAPKAAADSFLNHQFGWVPFLKDMHDMHRVYNNSVKYAAQIKRDNAQWVKRFRSDQILETNNVIGYDTSVHGCQPSGLAYTWNMINHDLPKLYTCTIQDITEVWYEGVFKYYRPEFDDSVPSSNSMYGDISRQMTLYGAHVNPTVIWKATPWTWLIDWFSNAGDAIQRAQDWATDSVVSKYMYLMHHRRRRFDVRSQFTTKTDNGKHDLHWYRSADIKRREVAGSSFSFVLSGDLSARQIAILGAVGLSRGT